MKIGDKIKIFRNEKRFSQQKLADLTGLARITIAQYESNKFNPKEDTLEKIAKAFNIPVQCFLSVEELLTEQLNFFLSKPVNDRIKLLRLCSGKTQEELIIDIMANLGEEDELTDYNVNQLAGMLDDFEHGDVHSFDYEIKGGFISEIAEALHVPEYILNSGLMEEEDVKLLYNGYYKELHGYVKLLNEKGKQKVLEYVEDLTEISKYNKNASVIKKLQTDSLSETDDDSLDNVERTPPAPARFDKYITRAQLIGCDSIEE